MSNLLSSFGAIKETNVSAMLGYLIHLNPDLATELFGIATPVDSVSLELRSECGQDRYDVLIFNGKGEHVVEVKLAGHSQPQIARYAGKNKHVYTVGSKLRTHVVKEAHSTRFRDWNQVAEALVRSRARGKRANPFYDRLSDEFILHLRENNMVHGTHSDVYVRDLSGESVEVYFNRCIYKCQPQFYDKAKNARFFAPYLTGSNRYGDRQSVFRSLGVGISFLSKVNVAFLAKERDIPDLLKEHGYSRKDVQSLFEEFNWRKNSFREHTVLLLGEPMRLFQRPITKYDLWQVPGGAMPPMSIDFGDLVAAANGLFPLKGGKSKKAA